MDFTIHRLGPAAQPLEPNSEHTLQTEEGAELCVCVRGPNRATLHLSGVEQPLCDAMVHEGKFVTKFRIKILNWAGQATLDISSGGDSQQVHLDVAPHPKKLGSDQFRELLAELIEFESQLPWGVSPGSTRAVHARESPKVVHPQVLAVELPRLRMALTQLGSEPLTFTARERELRRLTCVHALDVQSFRHLFTHPRALLALGPSGGHRATPDTQVRIDQPRSVSTWDHAAHRYLRGLVEQLHQSLESLATDLESVKRGCEVGRMNLPAQAWASSVLATVAEAQQLTTGALSRPPLHGLPTGEPTESALQVITDSPLYAYVHRVLKLLLDPGLQLEATGELYGAMRDTGELFELLILYRLAAVLQHAAPAGAGWQWTTEPPRPGLILVGPPAGPFLIGRGPGGARVELHYQATFAAYRVDSSRPQQSLSGERRPDYVVAMFDDKKLKSWLIFDAKYRTARAPIHDALESIHLYRDCLRWKDQTAHGAYIITPSIAQDAARYSEAAYLTAHQFGALPISAEDWAAPLRKWFAAERSAARPG